MNYFVTLKNKNQMTVVEVQSVDKSCKEYPLTKRGCLEAGRDLYLAGQETWLNGSSVDFPKEYKKGFKYDVRDLMSQGYKEAEATADAPRKTLLNKMLKVCSEVYFQSKLNKEEKKAFKELVDKANSL